MELKFKRVRPEGISPNPHYASEGSAGFDLQADIEQKLCLRPGVRFTCPTGLAFEVPEGFELQIRPRSGMAKKHGITVLNSPGTIDCDYRGEVGVILINLSEDEEYWIQPGERIAQAVLCPVMKAILREADELSDTERGEGGFGSSGK